VTLRRSTGQVQHGYERASWPALPRGYLTGLGITHTSTTLLDVAVGEARAGTSSDPDIANAKNSTAAFGKTFVSGGWGAGDGNSGVPSAAGFAASAATWHFFILVGQTGVVDFGYDTSVTATNLVDDANVRSALENTVIYYRRIASFVSSATPDIPAFFQYGDEFWLSVPVLVSDANPGTSKVTRSVPVPSDVSMAAIVNFHIDDVNGVVNYLLYGPVDTAIPAPLVNLADAHHRASATDEGVHIAERIPTNTSAQIAYRLANSGANTTIETLTHGWVDRRGRDD
jgi:hypothetical protein